MFIASIALSTSSHVDSPSVPFVPSMILMRTGYWRLLAAAIKGLPGNRNTTGVYYEPELQLKFTPSLKCLAAARLRSKSVEEWAQRAQQPQLAMNQ